jgi:hypothetical protein
VDIVTAGRRLTSLLVVLLLVGAPAVVLRVLCAGESCADTAAAASRVPFCPLPADLRALIVAGFRDGRSPDVMAASGSAPTVATTVPGSVVAWPATSGVDARVPIVFAGAGVRPGPVPDGTRLDAIAPTLEGIAGFRRPHPDVRSGVAIPGVVADAGTRLIVLIAWKGAGTAGLGMAGDRPVLGSLLREGAGTLAGTTGSLPLDPTASMTTIGTGALPDDHGVVGTLIRDDRGRVVRAWSGNAPPSIVSTLAEDLDASTAQAARVAIVARRGTDRGLVGGDWYLDADRDDRRIGPGDPADAVAELIDDGYGSDDTPDVVGVALEGSIARLDRTTGEIVERVRASGVPATFVVAGTGGEASAPTVAAATVAARVNATLGAPVVAHAGSGGLFLDRAAMAASGITTDDVSSALRAMQDTGAPLFADAFPAFAVSFSRYC